MLEVTRVDAAWIPVALVVFGMGGFVGNLFGGWLFDRLQFRAVGVILVLSAMILSAFRLPQAHCPCYL